MSIFLIIFYRLSFVGKKADKVWKPTHCPKPAQQNPWEQSIFHKFNHLPSIIYIKLKSQTQTTNSLIYLFVSCLHIFNSLGFTKFFLKFARISIYEEFEFGINKFFELFNNI